MTDASAVHVDLRVAALDLERREGRHVAQQRGEMVALDVGHMVGLGGGEQDLVDVRSAQQLGENAAVAVAEALQNRVEREPRVLERVAACQQRAQHVDQHDLARVMAKMILVERRDHLALVDLEALRHQRAERVRRKHAAPLRHVERREPEIGHDRRATAAAEEAAGLQKAQAVPVARLDEIGAVEVVRLLRHLLARDLVRPVLREERETNSPLTSARTPLRQQPQRGARPLGVALRQQRQVEQPFARIVDDPDRQRRGVAADLGSAAGLTAPAGAKRTSIPISLISEVRAGQSAR